MNVVKDIVSFFEEIAPFSYQESYDNSGLLVGNPAMEVKGILCSLDCTEAVIEDAIAQGCNVIVSHHPIVFKGLKRLTGANYVERTVIKAIQNNIALIAVHTNLDAYRFGVSHVIANKLNLQNQQILSPAKDSLVKLVALVPKEFKENVLQSLANVGAGEIGNYSDCSYASEGKGRFKPNTSANPFIGKANEIEEVEETKVEVLVEKAKLSKVLSALKEAHPYEEMVYDIIPITNENTYWGAGIVGDLPKEVNTLEVLQTIKKEFNAESVRYTQVHKEKIQRIAVCGGSGSFLLKDAICSKADLFLTADFKYHEFFDAENRIIIADIGHFESEQHIVEWFVAILSKNFTNFALRLTNVNTNPINYL